MVSFHALRIYGDGYCSFQCISYYQEGDEYHCQIRVVVIDYVKIRRNLNKYFVLGDRSYQAEITSFKEYENLMRTK
jgi:hypothetical protein